MTHRSGSRFRLAGLAAGGALLLAGGCSGGDDTSAPPAATTTATATTTAAAATTPPTTTAPPSPSGDAAALTFGLPKYPDALVDAEGRAVYTFSGDEHGNVTCLGACAAEWPPVLTVERPTLDGESSHRPGRQGLGNGTWQATYGGWPLYYFSGDTAPGQVNGLGRRAHGGEFTIILRNTNRVG
ncbi:hypothetical protein ACN28C_13070 [Plantactinospora sp. WMMC1484]|uniref:COG4315 family predicted lipoprotein n=1 Tax=Plantactinospora sp. WMMC1484 TaxID=3404122 RepID=UPI003BF47648